MEVFEKDNWTEENMNVIVRFFLPHLAPVIYRVSHHLNTEWI